MTTLSRDDVLRIAGEPVAFLIEQYGRRKLVFDDQITRYEGDGIVITKLYPEAQLLAVYAAGAEGMRERVVVSANKEVSDWEVLRDISVARKESSIIESTNILAINRLIEAIRALPITTTEGEQA